MSYSQGCYVGVLPWILLAGLLGLSEILIAANVDAVFWVLVCQDLGPANIGGWLNHFSSSFCICEVGRKEGRINVEEC